MLVTTRLRRVLHNHLPHLTDQNGCSVYLLILGN